MERTIQHKQGVLDVPKMNEISHLPPLLVFEMQHGLVQSDYLETNLLI